MRVGVVVVIMFRTGELGANSESSVVVSRSVSL